MVNPKTRRIFILIHLYLAAFMTPVFLALAVSGGLHLFGGGEKFETVPLSLTEGTALDFKSPSLEEDIRALLKRENIDQKFSHLRVRPNMVQLRPTTRSFIEFHQTDEGLKARRKTPNLQAALMELHKGHGSKLSRNYQKLAAFFMGLVVLGGVLVGLMSQAYRRPTLISTFIGIISFVLTGFLL